MAGSTVYIHPGNSQCRVYVIPYRTDKPHKIPYRKQGDWKHIALLNFQLKVVYIDPEYAHLRPELEGQMGGTFFQLNDEKQVED